MIQVGIANRSTVLTNKHVAALTAALQVQVTRDFGPTWGIDATLAFVPRRKPLDHAHWWLVVLDDSDQADALGYHDLTPAGLPIGKVFARTAKRYGDAPDVTASHELLEMLADPDCDRLTPPVDLAGVGPVRYLVETADAPEADELGYAIDGIRASDFVTPAWFEPGPHPPGTKFDFMGHCTRPFEILEGGYISYQDSVGRWHQAYHEAASATYRARTAPHGHNRQGKIRKPRHEWRLSTGR